MTARVTLPGARAGWCRTILNLMTDSVSAADLSNFDECWAQLNQNEGERKKKEDAHNTNQMKV